MAEGSASSGSDVDVLSAVKSLQEQLKEQQKVQVTILQQLSALQQGAISAAYSTPGATGGLPYPPSASEVSGKSTLFPVRTFIIIIIFLLGTLYYVEAAGPFSFQHI